MEHLKEKHLVTRVDASTEIGTGHLMRCLALAQAWKDTGGRVTFVTACQTEGLLQRLREEGFDIHLLTRLHPDTSDWEYTKDILAANPSTWVVLDGYHFDGVYQQRVKDAGHRLLVIDDMAYLKHYYADIVLNQNLHAEQLPYSCEPYTRLLLGIRYVLLRREFLAWGDWKREIPEVARRVLVMLGGSDPENHTLKTIQALQKVDVTGLEAVVAIGATNPHGEVLEAAIRQSHIPIRLIRDVRNMPELMAWADVAVSTAGSTVWELMFMGLPALLTATAGNQEPIARSVADAGGAIWIDHRSAEWTQVLAEEVSQFSSDYAARFEMSKKGKKLVDGKGVERIISAIPQEVLI